MRAPPPAAGAGAGEAGKPHVACDDDAFRLARNAGQSEPRRHFTLVHDAGAGQVGIGRVVGDKRIEIAGIGQRIAHDLGVAQRAAALREGNGAGVFQKAEFGKRLAGQILGQRSHRVDADMGGIAGPAQDEVDQRRIVDHRIGIGHRYHRRHAAGRRRQACRLKRFAVFSARFADSAAP